MDESKPTILFIDPCCPRPYDPSNIDKPGGVGGTEQTVVTLVEGLGLTGLFNVIVEQHNRLETEDYSGPGYEFTYVGKSTKADWVIVLRDPRPLIYARDRFPNAKLYLWSHDLADQNLGICFNAGFFEKSGCLANICVSQWHKTQSIETLKVYGYTGQFKHTYIYNPLAEYVTRTNELYDKNKLIWLASPHKGLAQAYEIFKYLIKLNPDFRLYVTNPGYMENVYADNTDVKERTIVMGTLPHRQAIQELRTSLCLFYPNTVFPETFGKIMSESNAVGTPVLTHSIGASREVLDTHPEQFIDCREMESVIKRVMKWYEGARPIVRGKPEFKLSKVIESWKRLLFNVR